LRTATDSNLVQTAKAEQRLERMEALVATSAESPEVFLALYLHQLELLGELGVLSRRSTDLFNLFSGLDFYPLHFVNRMCTIDNRLHSHDIASVISVLRTGLLGCWSVDAGFGFENDSFPLPASERREIDVIHSDADVFKSGLLDVWGSEVQKSRQPVFFLKQVLQYGEAFNGREYPEELFGQVKSAMPKDSLAIVIENPSRDGKSLAERFANDSAFQDVVASRLGEVAHRRLGKINEQIRYTHELFEVGGQKFQLMRAGRLSVFCKKEG